MATKRSHKKEASRRQGGEMTSTNSKNSGIKMCMTGEGGKSWERPMSNNGPIKAERKKESNSRSIETEFFYDESFDN